MLSLSSLILHVIEALAITAAIYLVTKKTLQIREMGILVGTITLTFLVLDLFAPRVAIGARQGSGFGLGFAQVAGNTPNNRRYYEPNFPLNRTASGTSQPPIPGLPNSVGAPVVEGMDDPVAIQYYGQYNPQSGLEINERPNLVRTKEAQIPSLILQKFNQNPFSSSPAPVPQ